MTKKENELPTKAFRCPHCKKELPEELSFCPYCMERIKKAAVITRPPQKENKKRTALIALFIGIFIISLICLTGVIWGLNGNQKTDTTDLTTENTTSTNAETDNKTNSEQLSNTNKNTNQPNGTVNQNSNQWDNTLPHSNQHEYTDVPKEQDTTEPIETHNQTTLPITTENTITVEQMAGRWNKTNADLNIYNFQLSGYTSQNHSDSYTISQRFNNSGVNMNFTFNKNLESFTLIGDNVANLNTMYQICRVALGTVADDEYNDGAFYDFLSADNWSETNSITQTKTGNFAGYKCKLTLVTHENTDQWGMSYTRYSFTLSATKI